MKKCRFNLRSVAVVVACLAVSMMLVSGCKKDDKKDDDDGGGNGDNPFVGTWISEVKDYISLEVSASTWTIEDYGDLYCSGTYTYDGNTATLKVTAVNTRGDAANVGDEGTAVLFGNGKILAVSGFGDKKMDVSFIKEGSDAGDVGTETNPFKVATVADLKRVASGETGPEGLAWATDKYYLQTADIDLSGEANWRPICPEMWSSSFSGTYDGGGHTISNLTITEVEKDNGVGLFGYTYGTIKNVRLTGGSITISKNGAYGVGCIAGSLGDPGTIDHCSISGITITIGAEVWTTGGVVGVVHWSLASQTVATVSNCMVTDVTFSTGSSCGGIAGDNSGVIENCYVTANVMSRGDTGGIVGDNTGGGMVQYCYITGDVTTNHILIGGIVGWNLASTVQNCVALSKKVQMNSSLKKDIGRIAGENAAPYSGDTGETLNNFAREDMMLLIYSTPVIITDISPTSIHGADVSAADYNGANSGTWWKNTAGFPESSWDFAPNRLPHLKGFDGLNQNPTVTP